MTVNNRDVLAIPRHTARRLAGTALLGMALLVPALPGSAQDFERIAPKELPANPPVAAPAPPPPVRPPSPGGSTVLLPALKGLVFLARADQVRRDGTDKTGIDSAAVDVLDRDEFRARLAPLLDRPVTLDLLNEISQQTVLYFREQDHPLVDVVIPEQRISNGTVQILALEFRAGTIRTEGNVWFSDGLLLSQLRTNPGDRVVASQLLDDVKWLNLNPFRRIDLVYERSERPGESNIALRTTDRFPLRVFGGYENTGTATTERGRTFLGANWGNVFGLDHQASYQFTASPDFWRDRKDGSGGKAHSTSHSGSYFVPLPWRHKLTLFGSYSESLPTMPDSFRQLGRSSQASVRYGVPLPKLWEVDQEIQAGFDWKRSNNDLEFGGASVSASSSDVAQWMLGYSASRADGWGGTSFNVSLFGSPGGFDDKNRTAAFQAQRSGATARYAYAKLGVDRLTQVTGSLSWLLRVQGQIANRPLLSSEQLGFGGSTSLRGYEERAVNGDQGLIVTNELRSPEFSILGQLAEREMDDKLQFVGFWDYGIANNRSPGTGERKAAYLSAVGAGLRYSLAPYLSLRLDYGYRLIEAPGANGRGGRLHLGLTAAY